MSEPKQRKKRTPMTDEAKAIMTAKRRTTIASKRKTILEAVVTSLLDQSGVTSLLDQSEVTTLLDHVVHEPKESQPASDDIQERRRVFTLLIDIEEFGYSGGLTPEKWLVTQLGLSQVQAVSYVEEYLHNRQQLKRKYEPKSMNVQDLALLSDQLTAFYKACPKYVG